MNVNCCTNAAAGISPYKAQTEAGMETENIVSPLIKDGGRKDQVCISPQARQAAACDADPFFEMETAVCNGDMKAFMEAAKKNNTLEINWDETVDPGGKIYNQTYFEALLSQYEKASENIEAYYAEAHRENLSFDNPYAHILQKYKILGSPYFRQDMTAAERDMAFYQERALLWGSNVSLNDPYALASSGGVLKASDADQIAKAAAREKLDEMIRKYQEEKE